MDIDIKAILISSEAIGKKERTLILDRLHQLERDIASLQHQACVATRDRDTLQALIANDLHAMTFQSLGQYRENLRKFKSQHLESV
jgi:hypothetical protein